MKKYVNYVSVFFLYVVAALYLGFAVNLQRPLLCFDIHRCEASAISTDVSNSIGEGIIEEEEEEEGEEESNKKRMKEDDQEVLALYLVLASIQVE